MTALLRLSAAWIALATVATAQALLPPGRAPVANAGPTAQAAPAGRAQDADELPVARLARGDEAPTLEGTRWLLGEPLTAWQPGRVTVLSFWTPASAASRSSLMALNEVVARYEQRRVDVVAIAVGPTGEGGESPAEFVERRADVLQTRVAEDPGGLVARRFLTTAGLDALPVALIVDGSGRMVWSGPPDATLFRALDHVVTRNSARLRELEFADEVRALRDAAERRDWVQVEVISNRLYRTDTTAFGAQAATRYEALLLSGKPEEARSWGQRMLVKDFAASAPGLNLLAWTIVKPGGAVPAEHRDLELALALAQRANELTKGSDPYILDTLARVHYLRGEAPLALPLQIRAVELSRGLTGRMGAEIRAELRQRLEQYSEALADADD